MLYFGSIACLTLNLTKEIAFDAILDGIAAQVKSAPAAARPAKSGQRKTVVKLSPKATAAAKEEKSEDAAPKASEAKAEKASATAN